MCGLLPTKKIAEISKVKVSINVKLKPVVPCDAGCTDFGELGVDPGSEFRGPGLMEPRRGPRGGGGRGARIRGR